MLLRRYKQQPAETKRYTINYAAWLADGETITGVSSAVASTPPADADPPTSFLVTGLVINGDTVTYLASGGDDGGAYKVTVTVQTSGGQVRTDEISYAVVEV